MIERVAHLRAVAALGERAVSAPALDGFLDDAVHQAVAAVGADLGVLYLAESSEAVRLVAAVGVPAELVGTHVGAVGKGTLVEHLLTRSGTSGVLSADRGSFETPFLDALGVSTIAAAVVEVAGRREGVLGVGSVTERDFDQDDLDVLRTIANMISSAIERDRAQQQLARLAITDELTGLANRVLLVDHIRLALARTGGGVAVVLADVDGFNDVNVGLGHEAGDEVLRAVAERILAVARATDTVARIGADEFGLLLDDLAGPEEAVAISQRLRDAVSSTPVALDGREFHIAVSLGVAIADQGTASADGLLHDANAAVQRAKASGRGRVELSDGEARASVTDRVRLTSDLVDAIAAGDLVVLYQPEVSLRGTEVWAEALVRWRHRELGLLAPDAFIELAEDTGLIVPLGRFVLEEAIAQLARWTTVGVGRAPTTVAVNISARQLLEADLVSLTAELLDRYGVEPASLWFELTETAVLREPERSIATLHELKAIGVGLALDDFGTGYSSLSYARMLPLDALKIDRSFISGMGSDLRDERIVQATVNLAGGLDVLSIAEGVETTDQLRRLRELGCDYAQGYLWAKPADPAAVEEFTRRHFAQA